MDAFQASCGEDTAWLAIWTKSRAEKTVAALLESRALAVWLPTTTVRRRWSDRWKDVEFPLFPNYLFAQAVTSEWSALLRVSGVLTVVKQGARPAWIREQHMADLKYAVERVAAHEQTPEVVQNFELGERVRVVTGPMSGLVGVVREIRGHRRLLVGLHQIGRALSISIGAAEVERYAGELESALASPSAV